LIVDTNERPHIDRDHQLTAHGSEPHRHKAWWIVGGIALLLLLVLALVLWRHHEDSTKKTAPAPPKITITTATAKKGDIGVHLDAIGTVKPVYTDSITSQVDGLIIAVHYKEGQVVKMGDPLVDIDSRAYRANLLQAQGALKALVENLGGGSDRSQLPNPPQVTRRPTQVGVEHRAVGC
jgi:membrane fusion protein, multidrug efflux system